MSIVSYFIKDLLTLPKVQDVIKDQKSYVNVCLCGSIVHKKWSLDNNYIIYIVDDGTACIKCMVQANGPDLVEESEKTVKRIETKYEHSKDAITEMTLITANCTNKFLKKVACKDLEIGTCVKITGKLKQFRNSHTIFADYLEKIDNVEERIKYMKSLFHSYDHDVRIEEKLKNDSQSNASVSNI